MSNAVTALNGASYSGLVTVAEAPLQGMITLRGKFDSAKFKSAVKKVLGSDIPAQRTAMTAGDVTIMWMSPDELLALVPYEGVLGKVADLTAALGEEHSLVVNVSDARAMFTLKGAKNRDVISKLAPVDLSPEAFTVGSVRRTRFSQVAAAFWFAAEDTAYVVCFRSVAEYMFGLLSVSADPAGDVGYF